MMELHEGFAKKSILHLCTKNNIGNPPIVSKDNKVFWTNAEFVEIEIGIGDWCSKGYLVELKIGNHDLNETAITSQFQNKLQIASSHHCLPELQHT